MASADLPAADAELLAAMGLACNARVRLCRQGEPCIVRVLAGDGAGGCRIGLARPLAQRIVVTALSRSARSRPALHP